jgi:hypothetical protein
MNKIFISYRRTDSADQAGRIFDRLVASFSRERVFKDVDSVPAGADFRRVIEEAVENADIVVLIVGPSWTIATDEKGHRRLDDHNDFVRLELACALKLGKHVIPVLVRGASMPRAGDLHESIRDVAFRNAVSVRPDPDFHRDMDRLILAIKSRKAEKAPRPPLQLPKIPKSGLYLIGGGLLICILGFNIFFNRADLPHQDASIKPINDPPADKSFPRPIDTKILPLAQAPSKSMPVGVERDKDGNAALVQSVPAAPEMTVKEKSSGPAAQSP